MKLPPYGKMVIDKNPKIAKIYAGSNKVRWGWAERTFLLGSGGMVLPNDDSFEDYRWPVEGRDVFVFDFQSSRENALKFAKLLIESGAIAVTVVFYHNKQGSSLYVRRSEVSG